MWRPFSKFLDFFLIAFKRSKTFCCATFNSSVISSVSPRYIQTYLVVFHVIYFSQQIRYLRTVESIFCMLPPQAFGVNLQHHNSYTKFAALKMLLTQKVAHLHNFTKFPEVQKTSLFEYSLNVFKAVKILCLRRSSTFYRLIFFCNTNISWWLKYLH